MPERLPETSVRHLSGRIQQISLDVHGVGKVYAKIFGVPIIGNHEEKDSKTIFKGNDGDVFVDIVDADTLSMSHPLSSLTGELQLKRQR